MDPAAFSVASSSGRGFGKNEMSSVFAVNRRGADSSTLPGIEESRRESAPTDQWRSVSTATLGTPGRPMGPSSTGSHAPVSDEELLALPDPRTAMLLASRLMRVRSAWVLLDEDLPDGSSPRLACVDGRITAAGPSDPGRTLDRTAITRMFFALARAAEKGIPLRVERVAREAFEVGAVSMSPLRAVADLMRRVGRVGPNLSPAKDLIDEWWEVERTPRGLALPLRIPANVRVDADMWADVETWIHRAHALATRSHGEVITMIGRDTSRIFCVHDRVLGMGTVTANRLGMVLSRAKRSDD